MTRLQQLQLIGMVALVQVTTRFWPVFDYIMCNGSLGHGDC
ncbi:MAG: hypothetical protein AAF614_05930 [Chloroflexota bacterium]